MTLKSKLLSPKKEKPISVSMLGGKFPVAKMSTSDLSKTDKKMKVLQDAGDPDDINHYTAEVILSSIVDEKDIQMLKSVQPSELLDAYNIGAISEALNAVYEANYAGTAGNEAAKNG